MELALIVGRNGDSLKPKLVMAVDNLHVECFVDIPHFVKSAVKRDLHIDRIFLTSTVLSQDSDVNELVDYWCNTGKTTEVVMMYKKSDGDSKAKDILGVFCSPRVTVMAVDSETLRTVVVGVSSPISKITAEYGISDYLAVEVVSDGNEVVEETHSEPEKTPVNEKPKKRSFFGSLLGRGKDDKNVGRQNQAQTDNVNENQTQDLDSGQYAGNQQIQNQGYGNAPVAGNGYYQPDMQYQDNGYQNQNFESQAYGTPTGMQNSDINYNQPSSYVVDDFSSGNQQPVFDSGQYYAESNTPAVDQAYAAGPGTGDGLGNDDGTWRGNMDWDGVPQDTSGSTQEGISGYQAMPDAYAGAGQGCAQDVVGDVAVVGGSDFDWPEGQAGVSDSELVWPQNSYGGVDAGQYAAGDVAEGLADDAEWHGKDANQSTQGYQADSFEVQGFGQRGGYGDGLWDNDDPVPQQTQEPVYAAGIAAAQGQQPVEAYAGHGDGYGADSMPNINPMPQTAESYTGRGDVYGTGSMPNLNPMQHGTPTKGYAGQDTGYNAASMQNNTSMAQAAPTGDGYFGQGSAGMQSIAGSYAGIPSNGYAAQNDSGLVVDDDFGDLTYTQAPVPENNAQAVHRGAVYVQDEDVNLSAAAAEDEYRKKMEATRVVKETVVKEVIKTVKASSPLDGVFKGSTNKILVFTGDRGSGITTAAWSIAKHFSEKVPVLYFDCDVDNHGLLNYLDYFSFKGYDESHMNGVRLCRSSSALSSCIVRWDSNIDILTSDFDVSVADEELVLAQGIVAENARNYSVVVVDCPLSKLTCIQDLILTGNVVLCVEDSKRGYMNMIIGLDNSELPLRYKRSIVSKGTLMRTKVNSKTDYKKLMKYIKGIVELEDCDWLSMTSVVFAGKVTVELLSEILEG